MFQINSDTRLQKEIEAQINDIKEGNMISATGQQNGDTFDATTIRLVEVPLPETPTPQ